MIIEYIFFDGLMLTKWNKYMTIEQCNDQRTRINKCNKNIAISVMMNNFDDEPQARHDEDFEVEPWCPVQRVSFSIVVVVQLMHNNVCRKDKMNYLQKMM